MEEEGKDTTPWPLFTIPLDSGQQLQYGILDSSVPITPDIKPEVPSALPIIIAPLENGPDNPVTIAPAIDLGNSVTEKEMTRQGPTDANKCNQKYCTRYSFSSKYDYLVHCINKHGDQKEVLDMIQNEGTPNKALAFVPSGDAENSMNGKELTIPGATKTNKCKLKYCTRDSFPSEYDYLVHCINKHGVRKEVLDSKIGRTPNPCNLEKCTRNAFPSEYDYLVHCVDKHGLRKEVLQSFIGIGPNSKQAFMAKVPSGKQGSKQQCTLNNCIIPSFSSEYEYLVHRVIKHGAPKEILHAHVSKKRSVNLSSSHLPIIKVNHEPYKMAPPVNYIFHHYDQDSLDGKQASKEQSKKLSPSDQSNSKIAPRPSNNNQKEFPTEPGKVATLCSFANCSWDSFLSSGARSREPSFDSKGPQPLDDTEIATELLECSFKNCSQDSFTSGKDQMNHCNIIHGIDFELLKSVWYKRGKCSICAYIYAQIISDPKMSPSADTIPNYYMHRHESGLYTCPFCITVKSSVFSKPQQLLNHVKTAHIQGDPAGGDTLPIVCSDCARIYAPLLCDYTMSPSKDDNSDYHTHRHETGVYKCPFCADTKHTLINHSKPQYLLNHITAIHAPKCLATNDFWVQPVNPDSHKTPVQVIMTNHKKLPLQPKPGPKEKVTGLGDAGLFSVGEKHCEKPKVSDFWVQSVYNSENHKMPVQVIMTNAKLQTFQPKQEHNMGNMGILSVGETKFEKPEAEIQRIYKITDSGTQGLVSPNTNEPKAKVMRQFDPSQTVTRDNLKCPLPNNRYYCARNDFKSGLEWMNHCKQHHKKVLECETCREIFTQLIENPLEPHPLYNTHKHEPEIYKCPLCPETSDYYVEKFGYLKIHVKKAHSDAEPLVPSTAPNNRKTRVEVVLPQNYLSTNAVGEVYNNFKIAVDVDVDMPPVKKQRDS